MEQGAIVFGGLQDAAQLHIETPTDDLNRFRQNFVKRRAFERELAEARQ